MFFVLVPVIMLSIVSGIIIDSFGSSRDLRSEVNEDQRNKCFICRCGGGMAPLSMLTCARSTYCVLPGIVFCSQSSSKFERVGRGFDYHTK